MPDGIDRFSIDKILETGVAMRADDQHIGLLFPDDAGDLAAAVAEAEDRMAFKAFFTQHPAVMIKTLLVFAGLIVIALLAKHPCGGAFHYMDQQIMSVLSALSDGIGQQLLVMLAEIEGYGDVSECRSRPVGERAGLWVHLGRFPAGLALDPWMHGDIGQQGDATAAAR